MTKIEIWASGSGSNAEELFEYFKNHPEIEVSGFMTNNPSAKVIERAERLSCPIALVPMSKMKNGEYLNELKDKGVDYIILAGYLKLVSTDIVQNFSNRIINVHPSLLPKYGGKGMYGHHVHNAVLEAHEKQTGISIHLVNNEFDKGRILAQFTTGIEKDESIETLLPKIQRLEHKFFPMVVEDYILSNQS
ncbi:MAG: phosphoribosylglycinamide formyltransferase [Bacteroidia bacterium]